MKEMSTEPSRERARFKVFYLLRRVLTKKVGTFLAVFFSLLVPISFLFIIDPASFQLTWKGRTFYLFFLWLIILELLMSWKDFQSKVFDGSKPLKNAIFGAVLLFPTLYVIAANHFGLNAAILDLSMQFNVPLAYWVSLSIEYLVLAVSFAVIAMLGYGFDGLKGFSVSTLFLGGVGMVYTIDNLYPYGSFTPFQIFVPTTASLAANVLNLMGYQTSFGSPLGGMPLLVAWNSVGKANFLIAWPCSGIQSFLLYAIVILLFFKKTTIPLMYRILYFVIGAVVTFFVNVLRIATIFIIDINQGRAAADMFHNYYGELYSMTWIIAYPLIIIGSRMLWAKIKPKLGFNDLLRKLFHQPISTNSV